MKNDSKSYCSAEVDVSNAFFPEDPSKVQFDLRNTIDVWSQIEFRARHQIQQLRHRGSIRMVAEVDRADARWYSTRQHIDD